MKLRDVALGLKDLRGKIADLVEKQDLAYKRGLALSIQALDYYSSTILPTISPEEAEKWNAKWWSGTYASVTTYGKKKFFLFSVEPISFGKKLRDEADRQLRTVPTLRQGLGAVCAVPYNHENRARFEELAMEAISSIKLAKAYGERIYSMSSARQTYLQSMVSLRKHLKDDSDVKVDNPSLWVHQEQLSNETRRLE